MKKLITLLLLASMSATLLASCASDNGDNTADTTAPDNAAEETTTAETTEEIAVADVPEGVTYDGYEFRMLQRKHGSMEKNKCWTFTVESEDGEPINDAMFKLRGVIEDRFDIKVSQVVVDNPQSSANTAILAGEDSFDAINAMQSQAFALAQNKMLANLYDVPYLDMEQNWWNQMLPAELTIHDKLFYNTGDITLSDDILAFCIFFNKKMHANYDLDNPYDLVADGTWTIDRLGEIAAAANKELNGDGVFNHLDQWGLQSELAGGNYLYFGAGDYMVTNNNDSFEITLDSERSMNMIDKVLALLCSGEVLIGDNVQSDISPWTHVANMFKEDKLMMRTSTFEPLLALRDMDADFGVLPIPKYDENQDMYRSGPNRQLYVISVPVTQKDLERTGIILESYAAESKNILTPAFYEVSLQGKVLRDDESEAMLDIIFNNQVFDVAVMFNISGFGPILSNMIGAGSNNVASSLESIRSAAETALTQIYEAFE